MKFKKKDIQKRRPKGKPVKAPYNIQELIKASYENKIVVWLIGESKAALLRENKITTVTTIDGMCFFNK